jgi:hypothetical protein
MEREGFHWRDGTYFKRLDDGSVNVTSDAFAFTIPASEWASIVAAVSRRGETGETFRAALGFHDAAA